MKQYLFSTLKQLPKHKRLLWLLIALVIIGLTASIFIGLTIEPNERRIITHYTAYGSTHFYRDQWTYLITFVAYIMMAVILGVGVAFKLLRQDREALALLYGWVSIGLIALATVVYIHLIRFI